MSLFTEKIVMSCMLFHSLIDWFKDEVNSKGASFDFETQRHYRDVFEGFNLSMDYTEIYDTPKEAEKRKILLEELREVLLEYTKIFERHRLFFNDLPRKQVLIDQCRRENFFRSNDTDYEIDFKVEFAKDDRANYYSSDF